MGTDPLDGKHAWKTAAMVLPPWEEAEFLARQKAQEQAGLLAIQRGHARLCTATYTGVALLAALVYGVGLFLWHWWAGRGR